MQVLDDYKQARELLEQDKYEEAFEAFRKIAYDTSKTNVARADACNMLGVIVFCFAPHLDDDESGINFYRRALEYDPNNFAALVNVAHGFGTGPCDHQDIALFKMACVKLLETKTFKKQLSKSEIDSLLRKYSFIEKNGV